ncbi:MAG: tetraacyldisaccharide 4'-kinase [Bacteroidota bacterium]
MVWWQVILFPLAILWDGITRFRNHLFNIESTPSFDFEANVIGVGNLAVGGTGKTPMVMYLADHFLSQDKQVAILSRGYRRSTRGLRMATEDDTAKTLGDESFMYWKRYRDQGVMVAVAEERAWAIPWILAEQPGNDVILLDDAFQHRSVTPTLNLLLTHWNRPFFRDFVMPSGRLRERRANAQRADLIAVTKCPPKLTDREMSSCDEEIAHYAKSSTLYTAVDYGSITPIFDAVPRVPGAFVAVAGLASSSDFRHWCEHHHQLVHFMAFPDHHRYTARDVRRIRQFLSPEVGLLTTEKDAVKLEMFRELQDFGCFYVPIKVRFLRGEDLLLTMIERSFVDYDRELSEEGKDN